MMIGNNKIKVIGRGGGPGQLFYLAKKDSRMELLYFKNTILHHFLVPWTINSVWVGIFNGRISDEKGLKSYLLKIRDQLKHEFYLPTIQEYLQKTIQAISSAIGRPVSDLAECLRLDRRELYLVLKKLGVFAGAGNYINEAYYITALTIGELGRIKGTFFQDDVIKRSLHIFKRELAIERYVRFPESYSVSIIKSSMNFFLSEKFVIEKGREYHLNPTKSLNSVIDHYESLLEESSAVIVNPGK